MELRDVLPKKSQFKALSANNCGDFWQLWASYQNDFYNLCLKWMGGNCHDAEDALNQAMLKACNEWRKSANNNTKIIYPKAWFKRIIYNFCMDLHQKSKREARLFENIDNIKFPNLPAFTDREEFPESNILNMEMQTYLYHQIASLPERLRYPFILHCCQDQSYPDIAKKLAISEENVRKRIQQARKILKKQLNKYLAGEDKTFINSFSSSLKKDMPIIEECEFDETVICNWESSIPTKTQQEEINYQVTVICLETLPHHWYNSPNSLGWR
ncbi:MAG: hypothetical protein RLZZ507_1806 [Cyanobacteriota bacterium]|jgi:RNA polymerase sigma-70 factor (ECF subfamily)